jgi:hypothetical protein
MRDSFFVLAGGVVGCFLSGAGGVWMGWHCTSGASSCMGRSMETLYLGSVRTYNMTTLLSNVFTVLCVFFFPSEDRFAPVSCSTF